MPARNTLSRRTPGLRALQQPGMLPEHLINHIISVRVDRGDGDMPLRLRAAQHVRAENHHIADFHGLLPELREQDRRTRPDDDHLHTVIRHRTHRAMNRPRPRQNRLVVVDRQGRREHAMSAGAMAIWIERSRACGAAGRSWLGSSGAAEDPLPVHERTRHGCVTGQLGRAGTALAKIAVRTQSRTTSIRVRNPGQGAGNRWHVARAHSVDHRLSSVSGCLDGGCSSWRRPRRQLR